jgi:hypothetical protein
MSVANFETTKMIEMTFAGSRLDDTCGCRANTNVRFEDQGSILSEPAELAQLSAWVRAS